MSNKKKNRKKKNIFIIPTNTCFGLACYIEDLENYKNIYEIKGRNFSNPLAILVDKFKYLEKITKLNLEQIFFLKNYENPFTILIDKKKITSPQPSPTGEGVILDKKLEKILKSIEKLPNKKIYKKIAFRVAHNSIQKKLTKLGPLFLTSANKSGNSEIFSSIKIKEEFEKDLKKFKIKILDKNNFIINSKQKSSDIFEFKDDSLEVIYLRKN